MLNNKAPSWKRLTNMRRWAVSRASVVGRSQQGYFSSFTRSSISLPTAALASAPQPLLTLCVGTRYRRCSTTAGQTSESAKQNLLAEYETLKKNDRIKPEEFTKIVVPLINSGEWEEAFQMYFELKAAGKSPDPLTLLDPLCNERLPLHQDISVAQIAQLVKDTPTFPISQMGRLLKFLSGCGRTKEAMEVVKLMDEANLPRYSITYSQILLAHKAEGMEKVLSLYEEMLQRKIRPEIQIFTSLLQCVQSHIPHEKVEEHLKYIKKEMKRHRVKPNYSFYRLICRRFIQEGRLTRAMEELKEMRKEGVQPVEGYLYFSIITNLARNGDVHWARDILKDIKGEPWLDPVPYTSIINACARKNDFESALATFNSMKEDGVVPDVIAYNAVIYACIRTGHLDRALELVSEMEKNNVKPRTDTFNALVTGYVKANRMDEAYQLFDTMSKTDTPPDSHTYNALLSGLTTLEEALALVEKMKNNNVTPGTVTYNILIDICGRIHNLEKACEYAALLEKNSTADMITYTTLFTACLKARNTQMAMEVVQRLRTAQKERRGAMFSRPKKSDSGDKGILADEQCYGVMMEICLRLKFDDEALALLTELMSQENLHPTPKHRESYGLYRKGNKEGALGILRQIELQHKVADNAS